MRSNDNNASRVLTFPTNLLIMGRKMVLGEMSGRNHNFLYSMKMISSSICKLMIVNQRGFL